MQRGVSEGVPGSTHTTPLFEMSVSCPKDLEDKVVHEVALDLTKLPKRELCKRLSDILEQGS